MALLACHSLQLSNGSAIPHAVRSPLMPIRRFDHLSRRSSTVPFGSSLLISGFASNGPAILYLDPANLPGCALQRVEATRKWGSNDFAPGRESADADVVWSNANALDFSQARNVKYRTRSWSITQGGKKIRPSRQNLSTMCSQHVNSFTKRTGP